MSIERTAVIVAFDDDTGEALHVNLVYHEFEGGDYKAVEPSKDDCEEIRQLAVEKHSDRKVNVVALPGDAIPEMDGGARKFFMDGGRSALVVR